MSDGLYDPIGANSANGVIPLPIGTLAEIRDAGYDPATTGCCHDGSHAIRGCPSAGLTEDGMQICPWIREGVGGYVGAQSTNFKGQGPKMIGVRIQTAKSEGNKIWTMQTQCYNFVRGGLLARMRHGRSEAESGRDHETIQVAAIEGDTITEIDREPVDPVGWEKATNLRTRRVIKKHVLQPFPRPSHTLNADQASYEQQQRAEAKAQELALERAHGMVREQMAQQQAKADDSAALAGDDDDVLEIQALEKASAAEKALLAGKVNEDAKDDAMRPVKK